MALKINGISFTDARTFPLDESFSSEVVGQRGSAWATDFKGPSEGKRIIIEIPLTTSTSNVQVGQLRGLAEQNNYLLLESDAQDIIDNIRKAYVSVKKIGIEQVVGTAYYKIFTMECELIGVPLSEGGSARISETWSWNFL